MKFPPGARPIANDLELLQLSAKAKELVDYLKLDKTTSHEISHAALLAAWLYVCDVNKVGYEQSERIFRGIAGAFLRKAD